MTNALAWNLALTGGLAIVLAVLCRCSPMRRRPALIHWLWLLLLVKLITPPLVGVPLLPAVDSGADTSPSAASAHESMKRSEELQERRGTSAERNETPLEVSAFAGPVLDSEVPVAADDTALRGEPSQASFDPRADSGGRGLSSSAALLAVWGIGTCVLLLVHAVEAARLGRWLRRASEAEPMLAETCERVASGMGLRGGIRSRVVDARLTPLLWGWRKPMVVVPRQLMDEFNAEQLRSIVAHELAHLLRRDHWANGFVCLVRALMWWNPVVWWAGRELRTAQELCCDAIAIDRFKTERRSYASTLLRALDFIQAGPVLPGQLVLGMGSKGSILRRFEMIGEERLSYRVSRWAVLGILLLGVPLVCMPVRGQEKSSSTTTVVRSQVEVTTTAESGEAESDTTEKKEVLVFTGSADRVYLAAITWQRKPSDRQATAVAWLQERDGQKVECGVGAELKISGTSATVDRFEDRALVLTVDKKACRWKLGERFSEAIQAAAKKADKPAAKVRPQRERCHGKRPQGKCSISGKVVSAATGEPVTNATVYLFYMETHTALFVSVAGDGTFTFKDIPTGPYALQTTNTAGYQDVHYDPEDRGSPLPRFTLEEGEQRSGIVFKIEPACQISGKIRDENGEIPDFVDDLTVLALFERENGTGYESEQARINRGDGSYFIDRLDDKPTLVMVIDWKSARKDDAYPPIYYPSTFSRDDAKRIAFGEKPKVEGVDITLQKKGGLILEGKILDKTGIPVPEAFIVVHRRDMLFDFVTDYSDADGKYCINGLGKGEFLVHIDAAHRGMVRTRTPLDLDGSTTKTQQNFTLSKGVSISGRLVDEEGNDWPVGEGHGYGAVVSDSTESRGGSFSLTNFRNRYAPKDARDHLPGSFLTGEGDYQACDMIFPTKSTFLIQGLSAGETQVGFSPKVVGRKVVAIRRDGKDIQGERFETEPGDEIEDLTIVIGKE